MQKAIIGTAIGVLGLGGLVLAGSAGRTTTTGQTTTIPNVTAPAAAVPFATGFAPAAPAAPAVQERIVYRDRPVARTAALRSTARPSVTPVTYSAPVTREPQRQTRSWKKSAVIIGGATAGGAGVGAVLGGGSGAKKGAVVGLLGGTIYDVATRNK